MKTNFKTLDQGRISRGMYARLIEVAQDYVVVVYQSTTTGRPGQLSSNMLKVEHFADESEAAAYFLALMDPMEFGDPQELLESSKSWDPARSFPKADGCPKRGLTERGAEG